MRLTSISAASIFALFAITGVPVSGGAAAAFRPGPDAVPQPTLEVHTRTLERGGGLAQSASGDNAVVAGQPIGWFAYAGSASSGNLCGGGITETGPLSRLLPRSAFVWQITLVPKTYQNARTTFDLEWARYQFESGSKAVAQGKSTLTLAEGERQLIDFARADSDAN